MRLLVTGSNGFIGSVLTPLLLDSGHDVVGLDSFYYEDCTLGEDETFIPSIRKDIRDVTSQDLRGFEGIIHLSALCNDPLGDLNPRWTGEINHEASVHLAVLAKQAGIKRFLFSSSCSMYGASGNEMVSEESPLHPLTPYAISKVKTEKDISRMADRTFSPVFLRNATVYGVSPRWRADLVLNNLVAWAFTTGKVRLLSDGTAWRPLIHVEDLSRIFTRLLDAPCEAVHNQAFNVGASQENYQVRQLAELVQEIVPGCSLEYQEGAGRDPRNYTVEFNKLRNVLPDWEPAWNARRGAEELYQALRENRLSFEEFQGRRFSRIQQVQYLLKNNLLDETLRWRNETCREQLQFNRAPAASSRCYLRP